MTKREFFQKLLASQVMPLATVEIMQHKNGTHCIYMRQRNAPNCGISTHRDGSAAAEKAFNRIHSWAHEYAVVFDDLIAEAHEEALNMQARMDREAFSALIESQRAAGHPVDEEGNDTREWRGNDIEAAHQQALNIEAERAAGKPSHNKENKSMSKIDITKLAIVGDDFYPSENGVNVFEVSPGRYGVFTTTPGSLVIGMPDKSCPPGMCTTRVADYSKSKNKTKGAELNFIAERISEIFSVTKEEVIKAAERTAILVDSNGEIQLVTVLLKKEDVMGMMPDIKKLRGREVSHVGPEWIIINAWILFNVPYMYEALEKQEFDRFFPEKNGKEIF